MTAPAPSPVLRAALWMTVTLASFTAMAVAARELSADLGAFEIVFFRSLIGVVILAPLVLRNGGRAMRTTRARLQLARNSFHFIGQYGWVLGISLLPLAEVFALEFTMPIWVAVLAVLVLGERFNKARAIALFGGFAGVLVILRPGFAVIDPAALIVLGAAFAFAISVVMIKVLVRTDGALTIVFYMTVMQLPMGLVPALFDWVTPGWSHLPWLLIVGAAGLSAHFALARALVAVDATVILPIDFLRLPLIALIAVLLYGEALDPFVLVGAAIVFGANYLSVWREHRNQDPG